MMSSQTLLQFTKNILINTFLILAVSQAVPFSMTVNQKYSFTGRVTIDCSSLSYQTYYAVTFPRSMVSANTVAYVAWGSLKMSFENSTNVSLFTSVQNMAQSSMNILISSITFHNISRLSVTYILLRWEDQYRNEYLNKYLILVQINAEVNATNGYGSIYQPIAVTYTYMNSNSSFIMLNGFYINSIFNNPLSQVDINLGLPGFNQSGLHIDFNYNPSDSRLVNISFVCGIFDNSFINSPSSKIYNFYSGLIFLGGQNIINLRPISTQITTNNTFVGLFYFYTWSGQMNFDILVNTTGISLLSYSSSWYTLFYLITYSSYCSYLTPNYNPYKQMCYADCQEGYIANDSNLTCDYKFNVRIFIISALIFLIFTYIIYHIVQGNITIIQQRANIRQQMAAIEPQIEMGIPAFQANNSEIEFRRLEE